MYNPNVPSSNMGIAPISGQPSQPMGPTPMGPPPPMAPPMMGGMPPPPMMAPPPMAPPPMAPPPMAPPIAPITEGLGGFGGSSAGRAGFSERMQRMTSPPKPKPMSQPIQRMSYGGMVGQAALREGTLPAVPPFFQTVMPGKNPFNPFMPQAPKISEQYQPYMPQQGSANALDQYGDYLDNQYGDPQFEQKRDNFLQGIAQQERQTFGGMGGFNTPQPAITERPGPQRNLGDSEYLSGIFGSQAGDYQDLANYQVAGARPMANGGSVSSDPVKMALGGFIGNPTTRDYSDDDPFGTDDLLDSLGIPDFNPNKDFGGGDDNGGDDDDYYNYLDDNYVYVPPPAPAPPVVVPEPEPESGGDDIKDRVVADLIRTPVEPTVGSSDPSVPDVAPDPATFTDLIDPFEGQIVQPTVSAAPKAIDAVGAAPIVGAVESGEGEGASTEVDVLGVNPISLSSSGITDRGKGMTVSEMIAAGSGNPNDVNVDISNIPAVDSDFTAGRAGEILDSLNVARPGGSSKTRIEDAGLANAMAAAQQVDKASSAVKAAGGSSVNPDIDYPDSMTIGEIVADQANRRAIAEANTEAGVLGMRGGSGFGYNFPKDDAAIQQTTVPSYLKQIEAFPPILVPSEETYNPTSSLGADPAPSEVQLEMAPPTDGGLLANTPGMQKFLQENPNFKAGDKAKPFFETFAPSTDTMDAMGRGMPSTPYSDPYAGDIVTTDVRTDLGIGTPYYRVGDPIDETTQKMLDKSPLKGAMLGESLTPTDVTFLNSPEMNIFASTAPAQTEDVVSAEPAQTVPATTTATADTDIFVDEDDENGYFAKVDRFTAPKADEQNTAAEIALFGPPSKAAGAFQSLMKMLSFGLVDLKKISENQRERGLEAYRITGKLAYDEKGRAIGVKDPDGKTILLGPQEQDDDDTGGDDDGCPPGFRRVNGVCMPIQRVAQNPATAISDSINKATLPSTLRPIVRDVVDDEDEEEETSDVGGLTIRRPKYFAGGGAVSEGMGSAIDNFLSSMGGSVKKKSNVAPVGMALGGFVGNKTTKDYSNNDYTDPYEELGRDYGYDPTDPFGDGDTSYGDDGPSDTVTADTFIGPMQPNVTYQPPAAPVDTGGDETDPFVKNAILSARNYYNDGSVGPTMQNASMLPAAPKNVNDITADYVKFIPPNMRNNLMMGKDFSRSLLHAGVDNIGGIVGLGLDDGVTSAGEKFFQTASENPLGTLYNIGLGAAQGVGSALYDPYKAAKTVTDQFISSGKNLMQPVTPETNPDQLLGDISVVGSAFPLFSGVKAAGNLTPKNNTISTNIKPSNETLTFYKGSPVAYDPEPGFPLGRARSAYSGTGEGNRPMGSPEALGEVLGVHSGKAWGAGDYQTQSPSTATGYRFMRSGLDRNLQEAAVKAAQDRVNFVDAGGRPDNFQTIFSEKIDAVDNAAKDASLGVKAAENVYADANRTAAERILDSSIFDTSRFRGDPRREIDPQGFYRSVVFGANDQIDEELYAIRDIISNRGNMDYGDPGYSKRMREINRDFPNLTNLTNKQIAERRAELRDLSKQYTGDVSKKYIDLTQTYRIAQDAEKAKKNLTDFETAVTADLPGVLYKTEIQEGNLGSFLDYDAPIDSQILTQATNALGVDAMNAKLFGTGPDAKKLQYNPKTQQYSFPRKSHNKFTNPDGSPIFANLPTERILAPQTVAEAKLYRDAGITHGQHKTGRKYKKVGDREIPIYNKIFFDDDATPVPVGRYNRGGQVGMGLGSL